MHDEGAMILLKRAYEDPEPSDGRRILVDRLWPRGVTKERAALDQWAKHLSPSKALCEWFAHDPAKWPEFQRRYREELVRLRDELNAIAELASDGPVTLVYAARDREHNEALVLKEVLDEIVAGSA